MPLAFIIVATVVFAAGCVGWWLLWRSRGFRAYWTSLPRVQRVAMGVIVGPFALLLPPAALIAVIYFGPLALLIIGVVVVFNLYAYRVKQRVKREAGEDPVCADCGFPRPDERDETNAVCSECGNEWWLEGSSWRPKGRRGAVPASTHALGEHQTKWQWMIFPLLLIGPLLSQANVRTSQIIGALPMPVVVFLAESWVGPARDAAREDLLLHRAADQDTLDAVWADILDERLARDVLRFKDRSLLTKGVQGGRLGSAALDRYYAESHAWELAVDVDEATGNVVPMLRLLRRSGGTDDVFLAVSPGFRIDDGPWRQAVASPVKVESLAYAYESYWLSSDRDRPNESRDGPGTGGGYAGFVPFPYEGLGAGTHELTTRIHLYAVPALLPPWPSAVMKPDGSVTFPPEVIWHETRELTAAFEVPESRQGSR
ncbi:MAG: hypothetical protein AAGH64_01425 [Planctomycetota bacterium]